MQISVPAGMGVRAWTVKRPCALLLGEVEEAGEEEEEDGVGFQFACALGTHAWFRRAMRGKREMDVCGAVSTVSFSFSVVTLPSWPSTTDDEDGDSPCNEGGSAVETRKLLLRQISRMRLLCFQVAQMPASSTFLAVFFPSISPPPPPLLRLLPLPRFPSVQTPACTHRPNHPTPSPGNPLSSRKAFCWSRERREWNAVNRVAAEGVVSLLVSFPLLGIGDDAGWEFRIGSVFVPDGAEDGDDEGDGTEEEGEEGEGESPSSSTGRLSSARSASILVPFGINLVAKTPRPFPGPAGRTVNMCCFCIVIVGRVMGRSRSREMKGKKNEKRKEGVGKGMSYLVIPYNHVYL